MGNVLRVFVRDVKRLLKTPPAFIVVAFLCVLPSLYTWFNVAGFWNPYENTGNLRVCVVNEDAGAQDEKLGQLRLGDQIVEELGENDQLKWTFVNRDEARSLVESGQAYAAFVIPESFSSDVASILSAERREPRIEYYVNEKTGPVAPKITDTGANTLDATINETFVASVSQTVAEALNSTVAEVASDLADARSDAAERIEGARADVTATRTAIGNLTETAASAQERTEQAKAGLVEAQSQLDVLAQGLSQTSTLAATANSSLISFSTNAGSSLDEAAQILGRTSSKVASATAKDASAVLAAKGSVDGVLMRAQNVVDENRLIIQGLQGLADDLAALEQAAQEDADIPQSGLAEDISSAIGKLDTLNERAARSVDGLATLSADTASAATSIDGAANELDGSTQQVLADVDDFRTTLRSTTMPQITSALSSTASATASLSADIASQKLLVNQAIMALDELARTFGTAQSALEGTDGLLADLDSSLHALSTDITAFSTSGVLSDFLESGTIDAEAVANFMMSPTTLATEQLYPLNAYGSAMAPLFINLTLWIGVFMLMVIVRLEVDDEGIERLTIAQRFFGRHLLLAPITALQAAICCTGCIALGVQTVNVIAFYLTCILASWAYLSIQYALSTTLQHLGKAICIILVFVQIPGATGLYPVEMTPAFFRSIYPLFPFTYGINAVRETVSGFYGNQWFAYIGVLAAFMVAFMLIGSVARPYLANLNRMFARQIEESDIINGESVELPARRWRMANVIHALSNREEYRVELEKRASQFEKVYPRLKQAALGAGIGVAVVATAVLTLAHVEKVLILTTWLVWFIAVAALLVFAELFRDSLSHQLSLDAMSEDQVRSLIGKGKAFTPVQPLQRDIVTHTRAEKGGNAKPNDAVDAQPDDSVSVNDTDDAPTQSAAAADAQPCDVAIVNSESGADADTADGQADEGGAR